MAKIKATEPMPTIDVQMPLNPYHTAVKLAASGETVSLPIAFDHPELGRAAGLIIEMKSIGIDEITRLQDFRIKVEGRTGKTCDIELLKHHVQIYFTYSEADEDVNKYRKARKIR